MKYFSAFSGIGGFDLGIHQVIPDAICIGYSEIEPNAVKIYEKNYPNRINFGDISKINPKDISEFDIFCGGFPCQDLSIEGQRKGLSGERSGLFYQIIRIIKEKHPKIIFLENVKGMLSSDRGKDFARILIEMDESGYDVEWQCLNTKHFGLPQNRERVFIIGHLRGECWKPVFPITASTGLSQKPHSEIRYSTHCGKSTDLNGYSSTITKSYGKLSGNGTKIIETNGIRILTPIECERLQGYPDNWTFGIPEKKRYECVGNSVTVNVIYSIMLKLSNNL